jgi:uncharacterized protein YjaG (DUF416 family)
MEYEQIIANLQEALFNQSRMLVEFQSRIRNLEAIIGVNKDLNDVDEVNGVNGVNAVDEVVYGYIDEVENKRIIHGDNIAIKTTDKITITSNKEKKHILFISQIGQLKNLESIEIQFDKGYKLKSTIHLANNLESGLSLENQISAEEFRTFCFERNIKVSFYDKNRGFYPDWSTIFS